MAFPAGVTTRLVTLSPGVTMEGGEALSVKATVRSSRNLVWSSTGIPVRKVDKTYSNDDGLELEFALPVTDQAGWMLDGELVDVSDGRQSHYYVIGLEYSSAGKLVSTDSIGPIAIPTGDGSPVDADKLIPAPTPGGATIALPDVWTEAVELAQQAAAEAAAALVDSTAFVRSTVVDDLDDSGSDIALRLSASIADVESAPGVAVGDRIEGTFGDRVLNVGIGEYDWSWPQQIHDQRRGRLIGTGISGPLTGDGSNDDAEIFVWEVDERTGVKKEVVIGRAPADDHNAPAIVQMPDGTLFVQWTWHNNFSDDKIRYKVSNRRGDIESLVMRGVTTDEQTVTSVAGVSYGQIFYIDQLSTSTSYVYWIFNRMYRGDGWSWEITPFTFSTTTRAMSAGSRKRFILGGDDTGGSRQTYISASPVLNDAGSLTGIRIAAGYNPQAVVHGVHGFTIDCTSPVFPVTSMAEPSLSRALGGQVLSVPTGTSGGTFTLTYSGQTTSALAWNVSAAALQTALEGLSPVGSGNVSVTSVNGKWVVRFTGTLATTVVSLTGAWSLTGGTSSSGTISDGTLIYLPDRTPWVADVASGSSRRLFKVRPGPATFGVLYAEGTTADPDNWHYKLREYLAVDKGLHASAGYASTPNSSTLSNITTSLFVKVTGVKFDATVSSGSTRELARMYTSSSEAKFHLRVVGTGAVAVTLSRLGHNVATYTSTANLPIAFTTEMSIKLRWRPISGTGNLEIWYSTDSEVTWTQLGTTITTGTYTSLDTTTAELVAGSNNASFQQARNMKGLTIGTWDGTTETAVTTIDFTSTLTGTGGETWTLSGDATQTTSDVATYDLGITGPRSHYLAAANYVGGGTWHAPCYQDDPVLIARRALDNGGSTLERGWLRSGAYVFDIIAQTVGQSQGTGYFTRPHLPYGALSSQLSVSEMLSGSLLNYNVFQSRKRLISV